MRTMYKEEVSRRKLPTVIAFFIVLIPLIYISDVFGKITLWNRSAKIITDPLIILIAAVIFGYAIIRCRIRYRYSIIADQLIIHKINKDEQKIVENIKIQDIQSVNKKEGLKSKLQVGRTYNGSALNTWTCCCIYKQGKRIKKFYFQPSDDFINKLNCMIINEKKKAS